MMDDKNNNHGNRVTGKISTGKVVKVRHWEDNSEPGMEQGPLELYAFTQKTLVF